MLMVASWPAQAVVVMTNGSLAVYDPNETYVASGLLGPETFSIGWTYTDPSYSNVINLTMPNDLIGKMLWAITTGINGTGISQIGDSLLAGESTSVIMRGGDFASPETPITGYFTMAALDMPTPIAFGPQVVGDSLIALPAVPEPSSMLLFASALPILGFVVARRNRRMTV